MNHNLAADALVHAIYQGTLEDTPWESFLRGLRQRLDAKVVSLVLRPPSQDDAGLILNTRRPNADERENGTALAAPDEWPVASYREHFYALDPFVNLPLDQVVALAEIAPAESLLSSDFYLQYLQPAGVQHILGLDTAEPNGMLARLRVMRGPDEIDFSADQRQLLTDIGPHFAQALNIYARLQKAESERAVYAGAVNQLAVGTVILDAVGRIVSTNQAAEDILAEKDGLSRRGSHLQLATPAASKQFSTLVARVLARANRAAQVVEALRINRPSGRPDLGAVLRPVASSEWAEGQQDGSVAVFISNPEQQTTTSREILISLFGFSKAESALALELARGLTLAEAAEALHISQHTARAQLKSIFAKSGVTRQAELMRLMLKSVASLA